MSRYILYVNVGQLPKKKAEDFVKQYTKNFKDFISSHNDVFGIPIKEGNTKIELLQEN